MTYGFGPTWQQTYEYNGVKWTLKELVEVHFSGGAEDELSEPHGTVIAPDGTEGEMYWFPILRDDVTNFDATKNIRCVILRDK